MIFNFLELENFGQYREHHEINLTTTKTKPILLIGGHNGGGKTTILDAMQLGLYGKRSSCYSRSDQRWGDYLKSWTTRGIDPANETRIKIHFQHPYQGETTYFRVEFSWRSKGNGISERKEVFVDDTLHNALTETWDKFIDSILPAKLSTLFFFDGEQIENLVRPETAQAFLESAISELLGIGMVEQLQRDLTILEKKKTVQSRPQSETKKLNDAEDSYEETQKQVFHTEEHLATLRQNQIQLNKEREALETEYEVKGGTLLDEQTANEKLKQELERQLESLNQQIIKQQAGVLPLHLVQDQLQEIKAQANKELSIQDCIQQRKQIEKMHGKYIREANKHGASKVVIHALTRLAEHETKSIDKQIKDTPLYLNLPPSAINVLDATLKEAPEAEKQYNDLRKQRSELGERLKTLETKLDATPEKGTLSSLLKRRHACTKELSRVEMELLVKEDLIEQLRVRANQQKERVVRLLEETAQEKAYSEDDQRVIKYCSKAQQYLDTFRSELLKKNLGKLEVYILESFQYLIKKKSLVDQLKIDSKTFSIELTNREGKNVSAEKLSAGERQLLAIAIFWGLQKASNRPIPVMIDTPMGRLDSTHRDHLVKRYFPAAAHQVILLSTDEEIVNEYYEGIRKHTYNEFLISYDEEKSTTYVKQGYF